MLKSLLSVYQYTKCSCNVVKKISHNFIGNHLNHNNFLGDILQPERALKLEVGVLSFNPRLSFPSVATDDRKQFQYLHIVFDQLNNKTGLLFYFLKSKPNSQPRPQGTFP